jgi:hypothetical protein
LLLVVGRRRHQCTLLVGDDRNFSHLARPLPGRSPASSSDALNDSQPAWHTRRPMLLSAFRNLSHRCDSVHRRKQSTVEGNTIITDAITFGQQFAIDQREPELQRCFLDTRATRKSLRLTPFKMEGFEQLILFGVGCMNRN